MKNIKKFLCAALALIPVGTFADTHLRDCVYDYKPEVFDFSADGIEEVFMDGRAIVPTVLDLQVGDLFIDEDGIIQVVDSIVVDSDGNLTINSSMPGNVRSFMEMVSIPRQDVEVETSDWEIMGTDAHTELIEETGTRGIGSASAGGMLGKAIPEDKRQMTPSVQVSIPLDPSKDPIAGMKKALNASQEDIDKAKNSGNCKDTSGSSLVIRAEVPYSAKQFTITPTVDLPYTTVITRKKTYNIYKKAYWTKENWYHQGSAYIGVAMDVYTGLGVRVDVVGKKSCEIMLAKTPTEVLYAGLYLWPEVTLMAGVTYQNYIHILYSCSASCDLDGEYILAVPHNFRKNVYQNIVSTGTSFDGSIIGTAGFFIGPKIAVGVAGFDLAAIQAKFGPEAKLTMPIFSVVSYNDPYNTIAAADSPYNGSVSGSVYESKTLEEALKDTKFQLYIKASVSGSLIKGLISTDFYTWKSSPLFELPKDWDKIVKVNN